MLLTCRGVATRRVDSVQQLSQAEQQVQQDKSRCCTRLDMVQQQLDGRLQQLLQQVAGQATVDGSSTALLQVGHLLWRDRLLLAAGLSAVHRQQSKRRHGPPATSRGCCTLLDAEPPVEVQAAGSRAAGVPAAAGALPGQPGGRAAAPPVGLVGSRTSWLIPA
jgi:hypothetical protein